jgi:hypothetical protein
MLLGCMGNAYRQRRGAEVEPTEMAKQNEQGAFEFESNLAQAQANRNAKRAEQTRQRWANKDRSTKEEPLKSPN